MKQKQYGKPSNKIIQEAEKIIYLTVIEAEQLKGILGRFVPGCLRVRGWYGCTLDGVKTLYIHKDLQ